MRGKTATILTLFWSILVIAFLLAEEAWVEPAVNRSNPASLENYLLDRLKEAHENGQIGCATLVLLRNGRITTAQGVGIAHVEKQSKAKPEGTIFLLSSLSKAVSSWGALKLVQQGKIKLDEPVLPYLSRWRFPGSEAYRDSVTLRQLLSHTAGLVDGYGHAGFLPGEELQTIEEMLNSPADANMGQGSPAVIDLKPGTTIVYSSAAYGIVQLLIEELSGMPFHKYMHSNVFKPLGMVNSYYELNDIVSDGKADLLAPNYDTGLKTHPFKRYTNQAGVSLRATAADLALLASAYLQANPVLEQELMQEFWTPQPGTGGSWGLGHTLFSKNGNGSYLFGHGGGSFPASGAEMRVNPENGDAFILLASGTQGLISELAEVWTYWQTGHDPFDVRNIVNRRLVPGILAIFLGSALIWVLWARERWLTKLRKNRLR